MTLRRAILGAGVLVVAAALVAFFILNDEERHQDDAPQPASETDPVLVAVDSTGAVVYRDGLLTGIKRGVGVEWQREVDTVPLAVTCAPMCPDAVLSGSDGGPLSEDPAPILEQQAELPVSEWGAPTGGKNEILSAGRRGALRVLTDADGSAWWEMSRPDGTVDREASEGANTLWFPASDGSAAVAMVLRSNDQRYVQQALVYREDGWHVLSDAAINDAGGSGCIAPGGRRWLVDGVTLASPTVTTPLQVEGTFGNCAFTSKTLVLSGNSKDTNGPSTLIVGVDESGAETWRKEIDAEAFVAASSKRDEFVTMGDGTRTAILYDGAGAEHRRFEDTTFAVFDEHGELVAVNSEGEVNWIDVS